MSDDEGTPPADWWDSVPTEDREIRLPTITLTNPAGTVSVSALLDGRIGHVELEAGAASMTESELAREIRMMADLARMQARSELNAFLSESMGESGHDTVAMQSVLERQFDMPTRESASAAISRAFTASYVADHEDNGDDEEF